MKAIRREQPLFVLYGAEIAPPGGSALMMKVALNIVGRPVKW